MPIESAGLSDCYDTLDSFFAIINGPTAKLEVYTHLLLTLNIVLDSFAVMKRVHFSRTSIESIPDSPESQRTLRFETWIEDHAVCNSSTMPIINWRTVTSCCTGQ